MPLKEYTATALYMAVLDDEISRRELAEAALFALGPAVTAPRELLPVLLVVVLDKKGFLLAKSELAEGVFSDFKSELSPRVLWLTKKGIN